tara:strand:- start:420 stop:767 length:348 start_codon:yes stop_codon:yes gene_type:complete
MENKCLFCGIVNREISADIIGESELSLAFKDISPVAPKHILIIPKKHVASVSDIEIRDIDIINDIFILINKLIADDVIFENGYRIIINNGNYGGQTVYHLHIHLMSGRKMNWPPG